MPASPSLIPDQARGGRGAEQKKTKVKHAVVRKRGWLIELRSVEAYRLLVSLLTNGANHVELRSSLSHQAGIRAVRFPLRRKVAGSPPSLLIAARVVHLNASAALSLSSRSEQFGK